MTSETPSVETPPAGGSRILSVGKRAVMQIEWTDLDAKSECQVTLHPLWTSDTELTPKAFVITKQRPALVSLSDWEPDEGQRTARFELCDVPAPNPNPDNAAILLANLPLDRSDFFKGVVGYVGKAAAPVQNPSADPSAPPSPTPAPKPKPAPRAANAPWSTLPPFGSEADDGLDED